MRPSSIGGTENVMNKRIWKEAEFSREEGETLREAYFRIKRKVAL